MLGICLRHKNLLFIFDTRKNEEHPIITVFTEDNNNEWNVEVAVDTSADIEPSIDTELLAKIESAMNMLEDSIREENDIFVEPRPYEIFSRRNFQLMMMA